MSVDEESCVSSTSRKGKRRRKEKTGRTDEDGSDVYSEGAVARAGDVLDEEGEDGFEGEVMAIGESDGETVATDELLQQGEGGSGSDVL